MREIGARTVAGGPSPRGRAARLADGSLTGTPARHAPYTLVLLHPDDVAAPPAPGDLEAPDARRI